MEPKFTREELLFIKKAAVLLGSYLFILLIIVSPGCARQSSIPTDFNGVVPVEGKTVRHTVRAGETLWRISNKYGVPLEKIAGINGISDPTKIQAGMTLIIPLKYSDEKFISKASDTPTASGDVKLLWPLKGTFLQGFKDSETDRHDGIDIKAEEGTFIKSAAAGKVVYSGDQFRGYGNLLIIEHSEELSTIYAHCKSFLVYEGDEVPAGHIIATVGQTGNATTPHLHFEVRLKNTAVDPMLYLPLKQ
jgi:lipoprotein YgeR